MPDMKLFAGNATPELAQRIADRLYISLGDASVSRFSDGEVGSEHKAGKQAYKNLTRKRFIHYKSPICCVCYLHFC